MHDPAEPCIAEELLSKLIPALIRAGDIAEDTILTLADELDHEARTASIQRTEALEDMACALRAWALEAAGPPRSQVQASKRRGNLHVIERDPSSV